MAVSPYPEGIAVQDGDDFQRILVKLLVQVLNIAGDSRSLPTTVFPSGLGAAAEDDIHRVLNKILSVLLQVQASGGI